LLACVCGCVRVSVCLRMRVCACLCVFARMLACVSARVCVPREFVWSISQWMGAADRRHDAVNEALARQSAQLEVRAQCNAALPTPAHNRACPPPPPRVFPSPVKSMCQAP
jgi:hypothetical protein